MTNRIKIFAGIILPLSLASVTALTTLIASRKIDLHPSVLADGDYSLTLDRGLDVENDFVAVKNTRNTSFGFKFTYYQKGDSYLGTLYPSQEEYEAKIANLTAMKSIQSVSVTLTSGSLDFYYGWSHDNGTTIDYTIDAYDSISGNLTKTFNVSNIEPSYIKLVATETSVIKSVTFVYECSEATTVNNFHFEVKAPTVQNTLAVSSSNYLWLNANFANVGTWEDYRLDKDSSGNYYYDFTNVSTWVGFNFTITVSNSNVDPDWEYYSNYSSAYYQVAPGQTELILDDVNFASQPGELVESVTLNFTINFVDYDSYSSLAFSNIQYLTGNEWAEQCGGWTQFDWTLRRQWTYSVNDVPVGSIYYFAFYMWFDNSNNYIGSSEYRSFSVTPTGEYANLYYTIDFSYANKIWSYIPSTFTDVTSDYVPVHGKSTFVPNKEMNVAEQFILTPFFSGNAESFVCSGYDTSIVRIDEDGLVTGLKAGSTKVTLTTESDDVCTFVITVSGETYQATWTRDWNNVTSGVKISEEESWFSSNVGVVTDAILEDEQDFFNGVDISSVKALLDNGTHYFNEDGEEEYIFSMLQDKGINWVRLRLWVDPYTTSGVSYGGGECDLANILWATKEAKLSGFNVLLDLHYSDFWTHPGQQILPKSWNDCVTSAQLYARIEEYTTNTLNYFKDAGYLPDMVQLGNEISSGVYNLHYTLDDDFVIVTPEGKSSYYEPEYEAYASSLSIADLNMNSCIKAASDGVLNVDSNIKRVVHWAKGSTIDAYTINKFFNAIPSSYYDYAALSMYPFYCFNTMNEARSLLSGLNLSKPWFIAETSYPYTGRAYVYEDNRNVGEFIVTTDSTDSQLTNIKNTYPYTPVGQANMIYDFTEAIVDANGVGVFYWEPAWVPNANVGWAGEGSYSTWSNQGFFSMDGKLMPNINLFNAMLGN